VDAAHRWRSGCRHVIAFSSGSMPFELLGDGEPGARAVARFASRDLLASGWIPAKRRCGQSRAGEASHGKAA